MSTLKSNLALDIKEYVKRKEKTIDLRTTTLIFGSSVNTRGLPENKLMVSFGSPMETLSLIDICIDKLEQLREKVKDTIHAETDFYQDHVQQAPPPVTGVPEQEKTIDMGASLEWFQKALKKRF